MANKTLKKKVQAKPAKSTLAAPVTDTVREFLYAGLGAFSVAQTEGGKLFEQSGKLFDKLVAEGTRLEKKSINVAETAVDDIKSEVETKLEDVRQQAVDNWDSLGNIFDERVSGTLERLGIPTTKDLNNLSGRVQSMSRKATDSWKEFEELFEQRVSAALKSLHIPGAEDLSKLSDSVQDVAGQVTDNWAKLESVVEVRVTEVLGGLKIPSTDDINRLDTELKKLSTQVAALEKQLKANAKAAEGKTTAKKALAPKAATSMTVADKKKAAEAISEMKTERKPG